MKKLSVPEEILNPKSAMISNWFYAFLFLLAWIAPTALGNHQVQFLILVVVVEIMFIMMSFFIIPLVWIKLDVALQKKIIIFIFVMFGLFLTALIFVQGEFIFLLFVFYSAFNKYLSIKALDKYAPFNTAFLAYWIGDVVLLFIVMILTNAIPMPQLGLTPGSVKFIFEYKGSVEASYGGWESQPHLAMAFGFVYFLCSGFLIKYKSRKLKAHLNK